MSTNPGFELISVSDAASLLVEAGLTRSKATSIVRRAIKRGILDSVDLVGSSHTLRKHPLLLRGQVLAWITSGSRGAAEWRESRTQS